MFSKAGLQVEVGFDCLPRPVGGCIDGVSAGIIGIKTARPQYDEEARPQPIIDIDLIRQGQTMIDIGGALQRIPLLQRQRIETRRS